MISGTEGSGTEWQDARDEALEMLRDTMLWNLPAPRWDQVGEAVAGMATAFAGDSPDALWQATGCLQLCGQLRVQIRLAGSTDPPAPTAVRERISALIDTLEHAAPVQVPDGAAGLAQKLSQAHRPGEKSTGDRP
jgi:CATRA-associated small protein